MDFKKVKIVKISDLLAEYKPAYGKKWPKAMEILTSSPSDELVIKTLMKDLEETDFFNEPVLIDKKRKRILNGMHRITATFMSGREYIKVASKQSESSNDYLEATFSLEEAAPGTLMAGTDSQDWAFDFFRSFPTAQGWVSFDSMSGRNDIADGPCFSASVLYPLDKAEALKEGFLARAEEIGARFKYLSIEPDLILMEVYDSLPPY